MPDRTSEKWVVTDKPDGSVVTPYLVGPGAEESARRWLERERNAEHPHPEPTLYKITEIWERVDVDPLCGYTWGETPWTPHGLTQRVCILPKGHTNIAHEWGWALPEEEAERCPTCGSDDPYKTKLVNVGEDQERCRDVWHDGASE